MVECPLGVLMAPGIYPDPLKTWLEKGLLRSVECIFHESFQCEFFFVLRRRAHRFVKFVPTICLTQMAFMRTPESAWKPELESVLWFDWDRALSRRTVCLSFYKATALAC